MQNFTLNERNEVTSGLSYEEMRVKQISDEFLSEQKEYLVVDGSDVDYDIIGRQLYNAPYSMTVVNHNSYGYYGVGNEFGNRPLYLEAAQSTATRVYAIALAILSRDPRMINISFESINDDNTVKSTAIGFTNGLYLGSTAYSYAYSTPELREDLSNYQLATREVRGMNFHVGFYNWNTIQQMLGSFNKELSLVVLVHKPDTEITLTDIARREVLKTNGIIDQDYYPFAFKVNQVDSSQIYRKFELRPGDYDLNSFGRGVRHFVRQGVFAEFQSQIYEYLSQFKDNPQVALTYSYVAVDKT